MSDGAAVIHIAFDRVAAGVALTRFGLDNDERFATNDSHTRQREERALDVLDC